MDRKSFINNKGQKPFQARTIEATDSFTFETLNFSSKIEANRITDEKVCFRHFSSGHFGAILLVMQNARKVSSI
jgi:hypothetical protein